MVKGCVKTAKDFQQILTDAGLVFGVYGYDGILNTIALYAKYYSEHMADEGYPSIAKGANDVYAGIFAALEERGYYDDCSTRR